MNALNLDMHNLDEYIRSLRERLEQPINEKLREYSERKNKMFQLLRVADLLQENSTIEEVRGKISEVEECLNALKEIWESDDPPNSPPAVSIERDLDGPAQTEQPQNFAASGTVTEGSEPTDEPEESELNSVSEMAATDDGADAARIAEEALRESRRRGLAGSNSMKSTPNGTQNRSYEVVPANNQPASAFQSGFSALKQPR